MSPDSDSGNQDDTLKGVVPPPMDLLTRKACQRFNEQIREFATQKLNDTHQLRLAITNMIADLSFTTGIVGTQEDAMKLAKKITRHVARLGLSKEFNKRLLGLQGALSQNNSQDPNSYEMPITRGEIATCMMEHLVYQGKPQGVLEQFDLLTEASEADPRVQLIEGMVYLISSSLLLDADPDENDKSLALQLLTLTNHDALDDSLDKHMLQGALYTVLAMRSQQHGDARNTFRYGFRAYRVARKHQINGLRINGLIYMGMACLLAEPGKYPTAKRCFERAEQVAKQNGDVIRAILAKVNLGSYYYRRQDYAQAEIVFCETAERLHERGYYEGESLLYLGLCQMYQRKFRAARTALRQAQKVFKEWGPDHYVVEAMHGLAYCDHLEGHYPSAIFQYEAAIAAAEKLTDGRKVHLLHNLKADLKDCQAASNQRPAATS